MARFDSVARLEALENVSQAGETKTDESGWNDALFVDRKRDEVVMRNDEVVSK